MEEVAAVRQAARTAVDDVEPERLRDRIAGRLDDAALTPGVLTVVSAAAVRDQSTDTGDTERAAGVQLIYEGLSLTRQLARDNPWVNGDRDGADLDILIADILVSRGFYLLARTEVAEAAVDVVRAFGRDQTNRRTAGEDGPDIELERDICELAVVAGVTAGGRQPTSALREYASDLGAEGLPENATLVGDDVADSLIATLNPTTDGTEAAADH